MRQRAVESRLRRPWETRLRLTRAAWAAFLAGAAFLATTAGATADRFSHTSTLLPDGGVVIAGGQDMSGPISSIALIPANSGAASTIGNLAVARSSATATLLPNGYILVAGGFDGTSIRGDAELLDPVTHLSGGLLASAMTPRQDHTATLLQNGKVLLCGGWTTGGVVSNTCDLFDPSNNTFSAGAITLQEGRADHTATLLNDGRVFLTGGLNPTASGYYLSTSEVYTPGQSQTSAAHALSTARAFHQATLMANGRILISGGFNGANVVQLNDSPVLNYGILDEAEIYDPASDSILPASPMNERRAYQSAMLKPDGSVAVFGGLSNVQPALLAAPSISVNSMVLTASALTSSTSTITGGNGGITMSFQFSPQVAGIIGGGAVWFSTPTIAFSNGGVATLNLSDPINAPGSAHADLAGVPISCSGSTCGQVASASMTVTGAFGGTIYTPPVTEAVPDGTIASGGGSQVCFAGGPLTDINSSLNLSGASSIVTTNAVNLKFPAEFVGAHILSGTLELSAGSVVESSSFTVNITYAQYTIPANTLIVSDGAGAAYASVTPTWSSILGNIVWSGGSASQTFSSCASLPQPGAATASLTGQSSKMIYSVDQVLLGGKTMTVSIATASVQQAASTDLDCYLPYNNTWNLNCASPRAAGGERFMQTGTLRPNGDMVFYGGKTFDLATADVIMSTAAEYSFVSTISNGSQQGQSTWQPSASMAAARANFTATPLPNGKILVAGGTSGTNVLGAAELYDPDANTFTTTGSLGIGRDLQTATLLPNGTVLVAGGFAQTATSTGAVASAEIYYPATGAWEQTSPMISARDSHVSLLLPDGTVLVAGGYANGSYLSSAEVYVSTSQTWQSVGSMITARALAAATLLPDGRVLITGGVNASGALKSTEIYDPKTRTFQAGGGPNMLSARYSHSATLLPHGDVLVAGGDNGYGEMSECERYNGSAFVAAASLNYARYGHSAVLLPNGNVAAIGGSTVLGNTMPYVELYHEGDDAWTSSLPLATDRGLLTAVLAQNGNVYAFGGYDGVHYLSSGESMYFEGNVDLEAGTAQSLRQSSVTAVSPSTAFDRGTTITAKGSNFYGQTEASGGGAAAGNSSQFQPHLELQAVGGSNGTSSQGDGGFLIDLSTYIYANSANYNGWAGVGSAIAVTLPSGSAALPYGWYHLRESNNAVYSDSLMVHAGPALPTAAPTGLNGAPASTSQITWTWTIPSGTFDGFDVYYATSGVFISTVAVQGAAGQQETWVQSNLPADATGQITVAAYNLSGDGPAANSPTIFSLPATPANVSLSSVTSTQVQVSWNANGNAQGTIYEISMSTLGLSNAFQSGDVSISTPVPTLLNLTTTTYLVGSLQSDTTYTFRVRAFNGSGTSSAFSALVSTETTAPLSGLQGLRLGPTSIQWSWVSPCSGQSPCSFNVFNATTGAIITSTSSPVFIETGLSTNTAYAVQVQAVTGAGPGVLSAATTVYTDAAPPGLSAFPVTSVSTGGFTLTWTAGGNPLGTDYQAVVTQVGGGYASTTTVNGFSLNVGGLSPPAGVFAVALRAVNGDGYASEADNPAAILALGNTSLLANAPAGLAAPTVTPTSVFLTWSTSNNSSSATYEVTYSTDNFNDVQTALGFSAHASSSSLIVGGLLSSTTYSFRVRAQNLAGQITAYSNYLSTGTSSGGAAPGQLGGLAAAGSNTTISGNLADGRSVTLFVPANAFPSDTFLTISSFTYASRPCGANSSTDGISIVPDPYFQPLKPVSITVSLVNGEPNGIPSSQVSLMRVDPTGTCVPMPTVMAAQTLSAQINHFSVYDIAQLTPAGSVDSAHIYPNPFYPSRGNGFVTIDQLPSGAWVRIFTLRGELVFEDSANGSGMVTWPGVNRAGRPVASGVYLVAIEQGSDKRIYKVAVER